MPDHEADGQDSRNRSRSPRRSRSRSPAPRKPKNYSGLKWKKSGRGGERDDTKEDQGRGYGGRSDRRDDGGRDRGYGRDRDQGRDRWDDRDRGKDRYNDRDRYRGDRDRGHDREHDRDRRPRSDRDRRDRDRDRRDNRDSDRRKPGEEKVKDKPEKRPAAGPPAAAATGERMITVTVNDRLGTKAQIPCLASDPVKLFKAMVAAKIGRPVHEIMLKRQGQRPFHDSLSLADYEISDGVQIDLELNTGD